MKLESPIRPRTLSDVAANAQTYKEELKRKENQEIAEKVAKFLIDEECLMMKSGMGFKPATMKFGTGMILAALEEKE